MFEVRAQPLAVTFAFTAVVVAERVLVALPPLASWVPLFPAPPIAVLLAIRSPPPGFVAARLETVTSAGT